jgi:hypothetical protein
MELSKQLTDWPSGMRDYMLIGTGKVHPRKCHEGPEVENRNSYTLSLTPALDGVWVNITLQPFYPRECSGNHCIGGWMGLGVGLGGCGKSPHHRDSIPGQPSP